MRDLDKVTVDGYTAPHSSESGRFSLGQIPYINRKPDAESARRHIGNGISIIRNPNDNSYKGRIREFLNTFLYLADVKNVILI